MNKEQRKFKKVMKARKIKKDYRMRKNIMKNNVSEDDKFILSVGSGLPKSKKYKVKKQKNDK